MTANAEPQGFIKKRKGSTLMQVAYSEIRESIITNAVKSGDVLSEQQIAQELGISRTPVREALAILENEGLVEIRRGIGAFVKPLSYKDISDMYEVRRPMEALAFRSAAEFLTAAEIKACRDQFGALLKRCEANERVEAREFYQVDSAFHDLIVERCGNVYVQRFMHTINSNLRRMQMMFSSSIQGDMQETIRQHLLLLDLLEAKNAEELERELDRQLQISKRRYTGF